MRVDLHHTHIFSSDVETTVGFWKGMFGAEVLFDFEIAGARNIMLAVGSGRLNIYDQPPREGRGGAVHHLGLQTDDLDALKSHMEARGFQFPGGIRERGYLRYIMAMAPDGILLEIFQIVLENLPEDIKLDISRAFAL